MRAGEHLTMLLIFHTMYCLPYQTILHCTLTYLCHTIPYCTDHIIAEFPYHFKSCNAITCQPRGLRPYHILYDTLPWYLTHDTLPWYHTALERDLRGHFGELKRGDQTFLGDKNRLREQNIHRTNNIPVMFYN